MKNKKSFHGLSGECLTRKDELNPFINSECSEKMMPTNEEKVYQEAYQKGIKDTLKRVIENCKDKKWEEEFEDEIIETGDSENEWLDLLDNDLDNLIIKFIGRNKVKIKARKGYIQIEGINK